MQLVRKSGLLIAFWSQNSFLLLISLTIVRIALGGVFFGPKISQLQELTVIQHICLKLLNVHNSLFKIHYISLNNLGECSDKKVEVIHEIEVNEGVFYGTYKKSSEVINGRAFFEKVDITNDFYKYGIWWACGDRWCIHAFTFRGQCNCIAFNYKNSKCLPKLEDSNWIMRNSKTNVWEYAGKGLIVRGLTGMLPEPDSNS